MKKIILMAMLLGITQMLVAQTAEEALRYANVDFSGTARSSGMGGAFSSLGGDISVANTNPAGLAIFRSSTVAITPGLRIQKESGSGITGEETTFVMPSLGLVFAAKGDDTSVKNWNFGITYNQGANYNSVQKISEMNSTYSFLDSIAYNATYDETGKFNPYKKEELRDYDKYNDVDLTAGMAYNTYLISPTGNNGAYESALHADDLLNRNSKLVNEGSNGEVGLSLAGNVDDMLYFGATLGIQTIDYEKTENYMEQVANPSNNTTLDKFYYDNYLRTTGSGVNLKLGVIFRPTDELRLGVAAHTPTFYSLEDEFAYSMESEFLVEPEAGKGTSFQQVYPKDGKTGLFEYSYRTPWKFTFGGSYIFSKIGLLSIDYDLVNYSSARFSDGDFDGLNQTIKDTYKLTGNLKIGAEVRLDKQFSLRGGYNHFGNMYEDKTGIEQKASQYSAGLGYRKKNFFIDASYQHYTQEYNVSTQNLSYSRDTDVNMVKLTLGYVF